MNNELIFRSKIVLGSRIWMRHRQQEMLKSIALAALTCLLLLLGSVCYGQTATTKSRESMMYSCETPHFLSISVTTPKRNGIPQVQIKLTDPLSREQGVNLNRRRIPKSQYEDVVVAPKSPDHSREHAIEVCGARPGEYILTIYEHGDDQYVTSLGVDVTEFLSAHLRAHEGRVRQFRFSFTVQKGQVNLTWLDNNGRPQLNIGDNDW